jgi:hypothetical protein
VKRVLISGALVLGGLLVAVLLAEGALRLLGVSAPIWHRPDPELGWTLRPGVSGEFTQEGRALVEVNADGRRDPGYPLAKPAGSYRIAVLGDSYSEAMQVQRDEAYWALLPAALKACDFARGKAIEVLNFGVSGYGTGQELLTLQSRAAAYRPDLVLLQFTNGNDVSDNSLAIDDNKTRPFFVAAGASLKLDRSFLEGREFRRITSWPHETMRELSDSSRVLQLLRAAKRISLVTHAQAGGVEQGMEPMVLAPPKDERWEQAWRLTERLISGIHEETRRLGARLVVFTVPYAIQVHPDRAVREALQAKLGVSDLFYPDRRVEALAQRAGIDAVALAPQMQRLADQREAFFHGFPESGMGRGHWNPDGHRVAAEIIAKRLCEL